jgi:hypothetical protein
MSARGIAGGNPANRCGSKNVGRTLPDVGCDETRNFSRILHRHVGQQEFLMQQLESGSIACREGRAGDGSTPSGFSPPRTVLLGPRRSRSAAHPGKRSSLPIFLGKRVVTVRRSAEVAQPAGATPCRGGGRGCVEQAVDGFMRRQRSRRPCRPASGRSPDPTLIEPPSPSMVNRSPPRSISTFMPDEPAAASSAASVARSASDEQPAASSRVIAAAAAREAREARAARGRSLGC